MDCPFSKEELQKLVDSFPFWYHRIQLPHSITTPGWAPISPEAYHIPNDLTGKLVLDVGAWDGYWTFEALKRGAAHVTAIDDFSDTLGLDAAKNRTAWGTFDLCRAALGYSNDKCNRWNMSIYDVGVNYPKSFDVIFLFGTIYHLRHPLLALDRLFESCKPGGEIYIESAILDDYSPYRGGIGKGYPSDENRQIVMEFYPENEYGDNPSNWFVPTLACLGHMVRAAGFTDVMGWKLIDQPKHISQCRGFIKARKK